MSSPTVMEPTPPGEARNAVTERFSQHPVAAGLTAGFFLWSAFPPIEWSWLAWIALVPLFWLAVQPVPRRWLYLSAWLGGLVFWGAALSWVRLADPTAWFAWIIMALIFSLWWPGFLALTRLAIFKLKIPLLMAAPIIWIGLEYIRAHILTGFPWYYLAHSQYRSLTVIQIADFTGSLGLSFLIAMVNALIVDLLTLPLLARTPRGVRIRPRQVVRLWIVGLAVCGTMGYGAYRLSSANFREGPKLALTQTNFEQRYKMGAEPMLILERLSHLVGRAISSGTPPDLIVWPETAYPFGFISIEPGLPEDELTRQIKIISEELTLKEWLYKRDRILENLHQLADAAKVPVLVGSLLYDHRAAGYSKYNSAILFQPDSREWTAYHKIHLVPFGEFIPFLDQLPWLTIFTPYHDGYVPLLTFGTEPTTFKLGPYKIAAPICFEDTVPHVARRFFQHKPDETDPDLLINLSNDGWFQGSSELDMHLAVSVFRTVEHRVPLARAVNTGITALIDGNGAIRDQLPRMTEAILNVTVPLDDRTSLYSKLGDWLGIGCLAVTIGLAPLSYLRRKIASLS